MIKFQQALNRHLHVTQYKEHAVPLLQDFKQVRRLLRESNPRPCAPHLSAARNSLDSFFRHPSSLVHGLDCRTALPVPADKNIYFIQGQVNQDGSKPQLDYIQQHSILNIGGVSSVNVDHYFDYQQVLNSPI